MQQTTSMRKWVWASTVTAASSWARAPRHARVSSSSARLIDDQGACGNDQIIIADNNETWLFATLSAHQWIAMKLTDDIASLNPNIGNLNYKVDLDDTENCLHSEGIESMPEEKGFAKYSADGKFDVAQTYGEEASPIPA